MKITIPFGVLQNLLAMIRRNHGGKFGIDKYTNLEITKTDNHWVVQGNYDCPPTYIHYKRGPSTNHKWKQVKWNDK